MRRWTLRVLCWLALGAVVNVAVALAVWRWMPLATDWGVLTSKPIQEWPLLAYVGKDWPKPNIESDRMLWWMTGRMVQTALPDEPYTIMTIDTYGWPSQCVRRIRTLRVAPGGAIDCPEGWLLVTPPAHFTQDGDLMPTHPLLVGLVLNTLFYGGLSALLWLAPGAIRRWHRARKRLCIHCTYPVADPAKPCPECGKPVCSQAPAARQGTAWPFRGASSGELGSGRG